MSKLFNSLNQQVILALFAIFVAALTWYLDWANLVVHCVYCRTERTVIGIMGFMMLLPVWHSYWTRFFFYPLGFLGAHVAAAQIFLHFQHANIWKLTFFFSSCALFIIVGLMMYMWEPRDRLIKSHDLESHPKKNQRSVSGVKKKGT